jgi:hypothetical protein
MEEGALLAEFLALADNTPEFASFTPTSRIHHEWLAKVQALVRQWDPSESMTGLFSWTTAPAGYSANRLKTRLDQSLPTLLPWATILRS